MTISAVPYPTGITFEEYLATVDEGTHAEWVDGEVVHVTPPSDEHSRISLFLAEILDGFVMRRAQGGRVRHAPFQMKLATSAREPDVLYAAPDKADRFQRLYLEGPADLIVEVVSPESRARDRRDKFREYALAGVREYWLVDPLQRTCEVYCLAGTGEYERAPSADPAKLESTVLPGFWVDPEWLWMEEPDLWIAFQAWGLI
jgi:Uma2 family endonuclease